MTDHFRRRAASLLTLVTALACGLATGCDSGGSGTATGGTFPQLAADFGMRRDVRPFDDVLADTRVADVDGDGLDDLVQGNTLARELVVLHGMPDGTFVPGASLPTSGVPWRSELADIDGDGRLDVAALSLAGNGGAVSALDVFLQGPQAGEFLAPLSVSLGVDPSDLAAAPVSGLVGASGPWDLFVALSTENKVLRFDLQGSQLVLQETLTSANQGIAGAPFSVATFDQGADGTVDLAVAEAQVGTSEIGRVLVYPRNGTGFDPPVRVYQPLYWPTIDNVGDVDGNGVEDLGVAQVDGSDVILLLGDTQGNLDPTTVSFGPGTTSVLFADLDQDGLVDAAATVVQEGAVYVRLADGPLSWQEPLIYDMGFLPRAITLVALPGDILPDIVVSNVFDTSLLLNRGNGAFRAARGCVLSRRGPERVRTADLDLDGDLDAVVLTTRDPALVLLENQDGVFLELLVHDLEPGADPQDLVLVDGDGDGFPDPIVTLAGLDEVRLYHSPYSPSSFASAFESIPVGDQPRGIAAADLDQSGSVELVVALGGDRALQVLVLDAGAYVSAGMDPLSESPESLHLADLDADLDLDVAVTTGRLGVTVPAPDPAARLLVVEWNGNQFVERSSFALDSPSTSIDTGDLNLDGRPEIVVGQRGEAQRELFVFWNGGSLAFTSARVDTETTPSGVLAGDRDVDGLGDILVVSERGELSIALGNGLRAFPGRRPTEPGGLSLLFGTSDFAFVDVDGDARALEDLLYVSPQAPVLWLAPNRSVGLGP